MDKRSTFVSDILLLVSQFLSECIFLAIYENYEKPCVPFLHFFTDNLQFYCLLLPFLLAFLHNYVERSQMLPGNQFRLHLHSFPSITSLIYCCWYQ